MSIALEGAMKVMQKRMAALEEKVAKLEAATTEAPAKTPAEFKPAKVTRLS